jgi:hypothetical protein
MINVSQIDVGQDRRWFFNEKIGENDGKSFPTRSYALNFKSAIICRHENNSN